MTTEEEIPKCPKCKSNEHVKEVKGCRCMSCPPWICESCDMQGGGYEFYWDDEEDDDN